MDGMAGPPCALKVPHPSILFKANDICTPEVPGEVRLILQTILKKIKKLVGTHEIICTAIHNPKRQSAAPPPPLRLIHSNLHPPLFWQYLNTSTLLIFPWCSIPCHVDPDSPEKEATQRMSFGSATNSSIKACRLEV